MATNNPTTSKINEEQLATVLSDLTSEELQDICSEIAAILDDLEKPQPSTTQNSNGNSLQANHEHERNVEVVHRGSTFLADPSVAATSSLQSAEADAAHFKKPRVYICYHCNQRCYNRLMWIHHLKIHLRAELRCVYCLRDYNNNSVLLRHMWFYHVPHNPSTIILTDLIR